MYINEDIILNLFVKNRYAEIHNSIKCKVFQFTSLLLDHFDQEELPEDSKCDFAETKYLLYRNN